MSVQRIASRYAKSLIDLAAEREDLDRVMEDIQHFLEVCKVRDFQLLMKSPIVHASKKISVFRKLFGEQYDKLTMSFLEIIIRKGREEYLPEIAEEFVSQFREIRRIASVSLTTATALDPNQLEEIKNRIASSGAVYENVELSTTVDSSIIGGIIIEFDDKLYDASVAHQLNEARKALS